MFLFVFTAKWRSFYRFREQHLLREDQVRARVVRQLVVVAHRDGVERARDLAIAAEDAAGHVDLVDLGVALARRDAVLRRVLGRDHADAVGGARRGAQRAPDALLEARVLEAVQLVAAAETWIDRGLLLGVLDRHRSLHEASEGGGKAAQGLAESARDPSEPAGLGTALDLDRVLLGVVRTHRSATKVAVTRRFSVARGSSTFQPKLISWS